MSTKKDKLLDSAQKFILKGQIDRAIKDYEQIVALDPGDIRHRQRLAELLVRMDRKEEAIAEYETIGKYYANNLYYLKAIAVYKQIQKLDTDNIKISLTLATLNEKQGLTGNALAEYSRVYSYYEKQDRRADALAILENMMALDPDNLNTRLKFAESRFATGGVVAAYDDFSQLALLLHSRGDVSAFNHVCERVAFLFPDRPNFLLDLMATQLQEGDAASVAATLQELVDRDRENYPAWQLLAEALRAAGEGEQLKAALQKMARLFPEELFPKENLTRQAVDSDDAETAAYLLKLHQNAFVAKGAVATLERLYRDALERMPNDAPLLQAFRSYCESTGDRARYPDVVDRAAHQDRRESDLQPAPVAASVPSGAIGAEPEGEPVAEDELDISLDFDDSLEAAVPPADTGFQPPPLEQAEAQAEKVGEEHAEKLEERKSAVEVDTDEEMEIELDLSEDQLVAAAVSLPEPAEPPEPVHVKPADDQVDEIELDLELPDELPVDAPLSAPQEDQPEQEPEASEPDAGTDSDTETEEMLLPQTEQGSELDLDLPDELLVDIPLPVLEDEQPEQEPDIPEPVSETECSTDMNEMSIPQVEEDSEIFTFNDSDFVELEAELSDLTQELAEPKDAGGLNADASPSSGVRRGLDQQLDKEDTETHYNLGIAFKEMGLFDDAITEFTAASRDPARQLDCIILQGMCCREKGDLDRAEDILKQGLTGKVASAGDLSPVKYELALLYESSGSCEAALALYREIHAVDPLFRDTRQKLEGLEGSGGADGCYDDLDLLELEGEIE